MFVIRPKRRNPKIKHHSVRNTRKDIQQNTLASPRVLKEKEAQDNVYQSSSSYATQNELARCQAFENSHHMVEPANELRNSMFESIDDTREEEELYMREGEFVRHTHHIQNPWGDMLQNSYEGKENIYQSPLPYLAYHKPIRPQVVQNFCHMAGPANNVLMNAMFEPIVDTREDDEEEEDEVGIEEEEDVNDEDDENEIDEEDEDDDDDDDDSEDIDEDEDEDDQSDASLENSDFQQKLDEYMNKFKIDTDNFVESKLPRLSDLDAASNTEWNKDVVKPIHSRSPNCRRNSMLPGSEMCKEVLIFNGTLKPNQNETNNETTESVNVRVSNSCDPEPITEENLTTQNNNSPGLQNNTPETTEVLESIKELKSLTLSNEASQTQGKKMDTDLEEVYNHYCEAYSAMKAKVDLILDIHNNFDVLQSAKEKFENQSKELRRKYDKICKQLETETTKRKSKDVDVYKSKKVLYKDKLQDIEKLSKIIDDSIKATSALYNSIIAPKEQAEESQTQIRKEELEKKLEEDEKKILALAEKLNVTASRLKEIQSDSDDDKNDKSKTEKKNALHVNAKISHLDHVLKEKSMDLKRTADTIEKEMLRSEIHHLRRTRDRLIDEKCDLDEKFQKEKTLSIVEERKLLEFGEAIEAIDAMIEHKNEMICGKKDFDDNQSQREKGERMLMERLAKLSDGEMRTLFYKYFLKVIDLKESSRNLEVQTAELENHIETQNWQIQTLTNALKLTKLEAETRAVVLQKDYQQKLHLMFKHFSEETSSSGEEGLNKAEVAKYKSENERLTKLLITYKDIVEKLKKSGYIPNGLIDQYLRKITSISPPPPKLIPVNDHNKRDYKKTTTTTKVTRQRNKLIIQKTMDSDDKKKVIFY
ncbi:kinesin-like protein costa [Calliopsis andreniformis]|uniref:kinesin-like protein costa n=1 Tax=Calliopsis andreniformis TaxID=337506 RepID=UPI003FCC6D09